MYRITRISGIIDTQGYPVQCENRGSYCYCGIHCRVPVSKCFYRYVTEFVKHNTEYMKYNSQKSLTLFHIPVILQYSYVLFK